MSPSVIPLPPTGLLPDALSSATAASSGGMSLTAVLMAIGAVVVTFALGARLLRAAYQLVSTRFGISDEVASRDLVIAMGIVIGLSPVAVVALSV